jgi:RNA recognition motif-containing protein
MANIDAAKAKNTVFIGGLAPNVDENVLVEAFSLFGLLRTWHRCKQTNDRTGDIMEVQIPPATVAHGDQQLPAGKLPSAKRTAIRSNFLFSTFRRETQGICIRDVWHPN